MSLLFGDLTVARVQEIALNPSRLCCLSLLGEVFRKAVSDVCSKFMSGRGAKPGACCVCVYQLPSLSPLVDSQSHLLEVSGAVVLFSRFPCHACAAASSSVNEACGSGSRSPAVHLSFQTHCARSLLLSPEHPGEISPSVLCRAWPKAKQDRGGRFGVVQELGGWRVRLCRFLLCKGRAKQDSNPGHGSLRVFPSCCP